MSAAAINGTPAGPPADALDFRALAEALPHMVWSARADGVSDYYNARFLEYLGKTLEEMQGWLWAETLHPDDRQRSIDCWTAAFTSGTDFLVEFRIRRAADGRYLWHEGRATPLRDAAGRIVRWFGTCTDIEERKRAEEALSRSRERMDLALRAARAGTWELDVASGLSDWSPELYRLFGLDPEMTVASYDSWQKLLLPADREAALARIQKALQECGELRSEYRIIRPSDGQVRWISVIGRCFCVNGSTARMIGITLDVTERKEMEENYRRFANLTSDYVHYCTRSGAEPFRIRWLDGAVNPISGYSIEDILAQGCFLPFVYPDDRPAVADYLANLVAGDHKSIEFRITTRDGQVRWVSEKSQCVAGHTAGELVLFGAVTDITERREIKSRLAASEEKFRSLMDLSPDIISIIDRDGILVYNSPAALAVHGYTQKEMIGRSTFDLIHPEDQAQCSAYAEQVGNNLPGPRSIQYRYRNKDGSYAWMEATAANQFDNPHIRGMIVISRNIEERKLAEERLRISEEMFSKVFHSSPLLMGIGDLETGRYLDVNEVFCEVSGYSRDEAIGHTAVDLGWISAEARQALFAELQEKRRVMGRETKLKSKSGSPVWCLYSGEIIPTRSGNILLSIGLDITERREVEEELRYSQEKFSKAFNNRLLLMTLSDLETGRYIDVNEAFCRVTGFSREEAVGRSSVELGWIRHEERQHMLNTLRRSGRIDGIPLKLTNKAGKSILCEYYGEKIPTSSGDLLMSIALDITDREQAAIALRESEQRLSFYVDNSPMAAIEWDADFKVIRWSAEAEKVFGWSAEEVIGRSIPELKIVYAEDLPLVDKTTADLVAGASKYVISRNRNCTKDGRIICCEWYNTILKDLTGKTMAVLSQVMDVTEREQAKLAQAQAVQAAEEANRAKSEFLANMSHEIRTPINGILGMAQLLEYTELSASQKDYLSAIRSSSETLLALVNDVLDLAKIEAGKLELEMREFSLRGSLGDLVRSQLALAHAKGLILTTRIPAELPDSFTGDQLRLRQILVNLLNNAIKFTAAGEINLAVAMEERQENTALLHFTVADSGIGINPEVIDKIFMPFRQADATTTREFGGTGLGLAICERLTELMGGAIRVESRAGVGSTFHVTIPLAVNEVREERGAAPDVKPALLWEGAPLRVLLAEDNEIGRMFFVEVLKKYGHAVDVAVNGAEAVERWQQAAYDLILMDVQMPGMDGIEAVRRIREAEKARGGHVAVIALTAHAMEDFQFTVLNKGFDGYVSKPTRIRDLFAEMKRCLTTCRPSAPA